VKKEEAGEKGAVRRREEGGDEKKSKDPRKREQPVKSKKIIDGSKTPNVRSCEGPPEEKKTNGV